MLILEVGFYGISPFVGYLIIYIIIFFFIIQRVKARALQCPHQPPTRGDNTVLVAQGGTGTPGATKQLWPPDHIYIYIYIYARSIKCRDYIGR